MLFIRIIKRVFASIVTFSAIGFASVTVVAQDNVLRVAVVANASSGELTFAGIPQVVARDSLFIDALAKLNYRVEWVPVSTAAVATKYTACRAIIAAWSLVRCWVNSTRTAIALVTKPWC